MDKKQWTPGTPQADENSGTSQQAPGPRILLLATSPGPVRAKLGLWMSSLSSAVSLVLIQLRRKVGTTEQTMRGYG